MDALVLSASPAPTLASFSRMGMAEFEKQLQVNVLANYDLIVGVWDSFFRKEKRGHIVAVLSAALGPPPWPNTATIMTVRTSISPMSASPRRFLLEDPETAESVEALQDDVELVGDGDSAA